MLSPSQAATYRRMTLGDDAPLTALFSGIDGASEAIDERTTALVMSAAPKLALALGYDVDAGLEDGDAREDER